jgi:hypothetical protein
LDFQPYDFSFIPIETLSVIYEQFLHSPKNGKLSRGRKAGAYYTPLPLVNYILNELEMRRPLVEGMRVLDPSCGSGAFLVQCYRALIEKRLSNGPLRPVELGELLVHHVYGLDRDGDACQVAEMSLILTLLDYTTPPDLENNPRFKLPILRVVPTTRKTGMSGTGLLGTPTHARLGATRLPKPLYGGLSHSSQMTRLLDSCFRQ